MQEKSITRREKETERERDRNTDIDISTERKIEGILPFVINRAGEK